MIQTRFEGANRAHRKANTNLIFQSYVYVLYPMSAVAFCASIYMTLAVTVERRVNNFLTFPYKTCCKTHQKRGEQPVSDETFSMRNWLEEKSWEVLVNSLNRSYINSCSHVFKWRVYCSTNYECFYYKSQTKIIFSRYIAVCRPHQYRTISQVSSIFINFLWDRADSWERFAHWIWQAPMQLSM